LSFFKCSVFIFARRIFFLRQQEGPVFTYTPNTPCSFHCSTWWAHQILQYVLQCQSNSILPSNDYPDFRVEMAVFSSYFTDRSVILTNFCIERRLRLSKYPGYDGMTGVPGYLSDVSRKKIPSQSRLVITKIRGDLSFHHPLLP